MLHSRRHRGSKVAAIHATWVAGRRLGGVVLLFTVSAGGCAPAVSSEVASVPAVSSTPDKSASAAPSPGSDSGKAHELSTGYRVEIAGDELVVWRGDEQVARNVGLLRRQDESPNCPSEGFMGLTVEGARLTVEQQNCAGWFFLQERISFTYSDREGTFLMTRYVLQEIDRRDPSAEWPTQTCGPAELGVVTLEAARADELYDRFLQLCARK